MVCIGFSQGVQALPCYCAGTKLQHRFKKVLHRPTRDRLAFHTLAAVLYIAAFRKTGKQ